MQYCAANNGNVTKKSKIRNRKLPSKNTFNPSALFPVLNGNNGIALIFSLAPYSAPASTIWYFRRPPPLLNSFSATEHKRIFTKTKLFNNYKQKWCLWFIHIYDELSFGPDADASSFIQFQFRAVVVSASLIIRNWNMIFLDAIINFHFVSVLSGALIVVVWEVTTKRFVSIKTFSTLKYIILLLAEN